MRRIVIAGVIALLASGCGSAHPTPTPLSAAGILADPCLLVPPGAIRQMLDSHSPSLTTVSVSSSSARCDIAAARGESASLAVLVTSGGQQSLERVFAQRGAYPIIGLAVDGARTSTGSVLVLGKGAIVEISQTPPKAGRPLTTDQMDVLAAAAAQRLSASGG